MSRIQPMPGATPAPTSTNNFSLPAEITFLPNDGDAYSTFPASAPITTATFIGSTVTSLTGPTLISGSQSQSGPPIPGNSPAGGISMTKPPQTAISFYKIAPDEIVTFGWTFTSILRDSEKLTVSAVCENGNTYPVGPTDGVIPGTATEVSWNLHSWQVNNPGQPLAQGTYTLTMWDEKGKHALPQPGLMRPYNDLRFGLYTPQPYNALASGWTCPDCRSAGVLSATSHPVLVGFFVSTLAIFLSGFHLLLRTNGH